MRPNLECSKVHDCVLFLNVYVLPCGVINDDDDDDDESGQKEVEISSECVTRTDVNLVRTVDDFQRRF